MSPLQLAVYWRLSLVFFLSPLLFFLDIFTAAIFAASCRHRGNSSARPAEANQSWRGERDADWWTASRDPDVSSPVPQIPV